MIRDVSGPVAWRRAGALLALGSVIALCVTAGMAFAGKLERPANEVTEYVADLRDAARLVDAAAGPAAWVGSRSARRCDQFEPAANKVAAAADAAKAAFERYRKAKSRYGTQEEIRLITSIGLGLREARGNLRKAAGEPDPPTPAEVDAALKEVGLFQTFVAIKIEDRLGVEGLADVLQSRSFREMRDKVVGQIHVKLRQRAEAEIKRLTGLSIRLGVPLREQIQDFLKAEFSRLLSRLVVTAGPAGIFVSMIGERIFNLVGKALKEALRGKGNLEARTDTTLAGFERLRRQLNALPPKASMDKVRDAVRDAQRALGATKFLKGDLERAKRNDLKLDIEDAEADLTRTLSLSKRRFLLDSDLVGEDFGFAVAAMRTVRSDVEGLAKKLGCKVSPPASGGGGTSPPDKGKAPTAAVCTPKSIRLEYFSSLGGKLGEYDARFGKIVQTYPPDPYSNKCIWVTQAGGATEAFVVFIESVPPGLPGRIASGDCGKNRPDSPPFYHSRKRFLSASGGNRQSFQNAVGGNEKIIKGVLAAAEAAGVGQACPKK
jgi:hypothetical protein